MAKTNISSYLKQKLGSPNMTKAQLQEGLEDLKLYIAEKKSITFFTVKDKDSFAFRAGIFDRKTGEFLVDEINYFSKEDKRDIHQNGLTTYNNGTLERSIRRYVAERDMTEKDLGYLITFCFSYIAYSERDEMETLNHILVLNDSKLEPFAVYFQYEPFHIEDEE